MPRRAAMIDFEAVYCDADDFCQVFLPAWHRQLLTSGERCRQRAGRLTLSEILTILIVFHQSQYRPFKAFYLLYLSQHARREFPSLVSHTRFVALIPQAFMPLCVDLQSRYGENTGISFMDSTTWVVCHNRLNQPEQFLADAGYCSADNVAACEITAGARRRCSD